MTAMRSLFTLLLLGALLAPQGLRVGASGCAATVSPFAATELVDQPARPGPNPCQSHHSGNDSLPRGMQHCAFSLDCASAPALAGASIQRRDPTAAVAVRPVVVTLPPTDFPEPQAPPPRS